MKGHLTLSVSKTEVSFSPPASVSTPYRLILINEHQAPGAQVRARRLTSHVPSITQSHLFFPRDVSQIVCSVCLRDFDCHLSPSPSSPTWTSAVASSRGPASFLFPALLFPFTLSPTARGAFLTQTGSYQSSDRTFLLSPTVQDKLTEL